MELQNKFEEIIDKNSDRYFVKGQNKETAKQCTIICLEEKISLMNYLRVSGDGNLILIARLQLYEQQLKELKDESIYK